MAGDRISKTSIDNSGIDPIREGMRSRLMRFGAAIADRARLVLDGPVDPQAEHEERLRAHGYVRITEIDPDGGPQKTRWMKGVETPHDEEK